MSLEAELAKEIRKSKIQKAILGTVAVAGIMAVAVVAPNIFSAFRQPFTRQQKYKTNRTIDKLVKAGLLTWEKTDRGTFTRLTSKGEKILDEVERSNFNLKKPKHWDQRWRVIIFDIPEKRKVVRERIRYTLMQIGFIRLQDSVWIYPYDCEELILLLKADFKIGKDIIYMIVEKLEGDRHLRNHFNIK